MPDTSNRKLILGSTSVYRRELLGRLNIPFTVESPDVDETPLPGEAPAALACRLALAKAQAVAERFHDCVVIGSDQVADLDGQALGKPGTHERAVAQLRQMRGKTVVFQTAVAVVCKNGSFCQQALAPVRVTFRAKSEGLGIVLLQSIENDDPTALVGLPLIRTSQMLRAAGIQLLGST